MNSPTHPSKVMQLNRTIHTIAEGGKPREANSVEAPKVMPSPTTIVNPSTILGTANFTGAITVGAVVVGTIRLAPQRLQYFSSAVISLPQPGQYIGPSSAGNFNTGVAKMQEQEQLAGA